MSYVVEVSKNVTIKQGLNAKIKPASKSTAKAKSIDSFDITLRVGVAFADKQLKKKGWFVDSDEFGIKVGAQAIHLASAAWTDLFDFIPTFENVAKWVCDQLKAETKQLEYVEIENKTLGVVTQYIP